MGRHLASDKKVKFFVFVSGEYPTLSSPSIRGENGQQVAQWVLPGIPQNSPALKGEYPAFFVNLTYYSGGIVIRLARKTLRFLELRYTSRPSKDAETEKSLGQSHKTYIFNIVIKH
jgi:hypothetical protein